MQQKESSSSLKGVPKHTHTHTYTHLTYIHTYIQYLNALGSDFFVRTYLSIYLSIYLFIYLFIYLSIYLSIHLSIYPWMYAAVRYRKTETCLFFDSVCGCSYSRWYSNRYLHLIPRSSMIIGEQALLVNIQRLHDLTDSGNAVMR